MDSVPDRRQFDLHKLIYPKFHEIEADDTRHIVRIINPEEGKRDYYLMAPSQQIYDEVVKKCQELIAVWSKEGDAEDGGDAAEAAAEEEEYGEHEDADNEESLIEFPAGEPWYVVIMYLFLFPLKLLMHISIPDVRHLSVDGESKATTTMASVAVVSCLIWLIIGSYAMVASLEALADLMDIPDAVIGVTVSAAGTSLPNYVASQCAARQGFGNMAISNAFGSNTFNILIGLGMPWTLYTIFVTKGEPYDGLQDDGITVSVMIMTVVLLAFLVLVFASGFTLYKWSAPVQLALYAAYLAYAIGSVYLGKSDD
uniref:Sodium/calcium exchanger membrane region domain-containing protein n=1 Tax=Trieres chinensis TaxID=1514140 RepID=A0A7S2EXD8_TRICV|mmetsp:Transcript_9808/g.20744  ORF Transcript_9808/g.20744 Transcript_9808/m.20744 type:complete len:312 (+) Transcript_9808:1-936(+)